MVIFEVFNKKWMSEELLTAVIVVNAFVRSVIEVLADVLQLIQRLHIVVGLDDKLHVFAVLALILPKVTKVLG